MLEHDEDRVIRAEEACTDDEAFADLNLIGESPSFRAVLKLVRRIASSNATTLIQGETGTGKELIAGALHYLSRRRNGPFISINCGAVPDSLFEAEFFGHARGAFTDARESRDGLITQARGGTLFLDELEALCSRGQVALLRFLENQEYRPVGGTIVRRADARVVGSTNAELGQLAASGAYRHDLLFRLSVLVIDLPPLRARDDDVVVLARAFLDRFSRQYGRPPKSLHPDAIRYLRSHPWPGNVRELENLMHREFLLNDDPLIRLSTPAAPHANAAAVVEAGRGAEVDAERAAARGALTATSFREAKAQAIAEFERRYVTELLKRAKGNISLAARLAGKERSRLGKLLRKHGVSRSEFLADAS
jgi:two-component system, NtrC family, response regulator GlrR